MAKLRLPRLSPSDVRKLSRYLHKAIQEADVSSSSPRIQTRPNSSPMPFWLGGPKPTPEEFRDQLRFERAQMDRAYEDVRKGRVPGYIGHEEVTVGDGFSSVTYRRGSVTFRGV